ncbi:MAG: hypothetical protein M3014_07485 [Chloroflexota bacterium]|nr:hypothetical protein [Chloroflexota bacterium]
MECVAVDDYTTIAYLRSLVDRAEEARQLDQSPKELTSSMSVEVGGLLDYFRSKSDEEINALLCRPESRQAVAHEVADVLYHVLALASSIDFDLSAVFRDKMASSPSRYSTRNLHADLQERAAS